MIKVPYNVINFAQGNTEPYELFKDYYNHYQAIHFGKKLPYREGDFADKTRAMDKLLRAEIARHANVSGEFSTEVLAVNPMVSWAVFAVVNAMIDMVLPDHMIDSTGIYTDVRTGGFGDSFAFEVKPRDLFIVTKAGRGKRNAEIQMNFTGQATVTPTEHDITVGVTLYEVLSGKINLAEFVMKAVMAIESEMLLDVYTALNGAMTNLPSTPVDERLQVTGWTQDDGTDLAEKVTAWNGGSKAVFVGTSSALAKILPAGNNYRFDIDSDFVRRGYLTTAFGYDLFAMRNVADHKNPFKMVMDGKRIYVLSPSSDKLVKLCLEGSTIAITSGVYENANLHQTTTLKKSWGCGVITNSIAGMITLS